VKHYLGPRKKTLVDRAQGVGELVLDDRVEVDCGGARHAAAEIIGGKWRRRKSWSHSP
jgi:hypothetical protein